ncbi:MAG TPA: immunoglobulin domain-containing protein, partial [Methylomirabilota bacterium]|nr:immunoglobulin domain-containing protein [Methylomirabilota bacterium]
LLLVSFDPNDGAQRAAFTAKYGSFGGAPLMGPYGGKLDNSADGIELYRPDTPNLDGSVPYILVEEVRYRDSAPWPPAADGAGAELQRIDSAAFGNDPINWQGAAPLQIIRPPESQTVSAGTDVTLSVLAAGTGTLRFQWRRDGVPVVGATNLTLELRNVQLHQEGAYTVSVTDNTGTVISAPAYLSILQAPSIVRSPTSQRVVQGGTVVLSVEAAGSLPLGFRWRRSGTTTNFQILNQRTSYLVVTNVQSTATYTVVVTNSVNNNGVISGSAVITVIPDTDRDGLPDEWETAYGLNPTGPDSEVDADGDGLTNGEEYVAGTDPQDPASYLKVEAAEPYELGGAVIYFNAASNRTYTVEYCDAAVGGAWLKLVDVVATTNSRPVSVTNAAPDAAMRFYRLLTPRRP